MYEVLKRQVHPLMEQPSCRLKVYWRSFWAACGDPQRFEWINTEQALGHPVTVTGYDYITPRKGNPTVVTIPWNEEIADKMKSVLEHLMESMRAGLFARGPDCMFCRPKGICGGSIQRGRAPDDPLWVHYRSATGGPALPEDELGGDS